MPPPAALLARAAETPLAPAANAKAGAANRAD